MFAPISRSGLKTVATQLIVLLGVSIASVTAGAQATTKPAPKAAAPETLTYGPAPAVFPKGAQMAVVSGNPSAAGNYVVRLKLPGGYRIQPHFHPTAEHIQVRSGVFLVGMGDVFDLKTTKRLTSGDTITAAATMHHFAAAQGQTVVQVSGTGPFKLTYVNPADLPKP